MGRAARTLVAIALAWLAAVTVNRSLRRVRGRSMSPTLEPGDLVLTLPWRGRPRRGAVVLVRDPRDPLHVQVKRTVGLPGERLGVHRGRLHVDGTPMLEATTSGRGPDGDLVVPPGHVAVLGDARDASTDSRTYGAVPLELVDARVLLRLSRGPALLTRAPRPVRLAPTVDEHGAA